MSADCDTQDAICNVLNLNKINSLGRYLGIPITGKKLKRSDCEFIVEKLRNKLASWKAKFLSFAGRQVLAQACLNAIPNYYSQVCFLPATTHSDIDRIIRNFLQGSTDDTKKMHYVNWNTVCLPKSKGGLSLKSAREANFANMAKLQWRLFF